MTHFLLMYLLEGERGAEILNKDVKSVYRV